MIALLRILLASASILMTAGTAASFVQSPHWLFRLWDFPRVQISLVSLFSTVLHSNEFKLIDLQRLPAIGSDHFPIFIELLYDPQAAAEQPETEKKPGDEEEAREKLEKQAEAVATGDDRPKDA